MPLLALEIPPDRVAVAIAEEAALADRDVDSIEERLLRVGAAPGEVAALALTVGRAGRASSARTLGAARTRIQGSVEAKAIGVAIELLSVEPPRWLERAERGYRRVDPFTGEELFIEDLLAAHWHHEKRWGPPLRADHLCPVFDARDARSPEELVARIRAGAIGLVTFEPGRFSTKIHPALRLARAGLTEDPSLRHLIRWTAVRSIGTVARRFAAHAAYETTTTTPPIILPANPSIGTPTLVDVMTRLSNAART